MDDSLKVEKLSQDSVLRVRRPLKVLTACMWLQLMSTAAKANHTLTPTAHPATALGVIVSSTAARADTLDREGWATTRKVHK